MIASAVLFLLALFLIKDTNIFKKAVSLVQNKQGVLVYSGTVGDLINKDTDGDGIPDWEESLYGLDPTKKETTPGILDSVALSKITGQENSVGTAAEDNNTENLTETDKFSREFFSTAAVLSQNGSVDQGTVDQISSSLADKISNAAPRKVYTLLDVKMTNDNSTTSVQKYVDTLKNIYTKYSTTVRVEDVLAKFTGDGTTMDETALKGLDPSIKYLQEIVDAWVGMSVPSDLAKQHLDALNGMERLLENVTDMQLYSKDPVIAMGAIKNYLKNVDLLQSALDARAAAISQKLKS